MTNLDEYAEGLSLEVTYWIKVAKEQSDRADAAEAELGQRELHHFETEQMLARVEALADEYDALGWDARAGALRDALRGDA